MEGWAGPGTIGHSLGGQSKRSLLVVTKAPLPLNYINLEIRVERISHL